jgi:hypothetical protein
MNIQENLKPTGMVTISHFNSEGELLNKFEVPNLVVTSGKQYIASRIKDTTYTAMTNMAIGTSSTAASASDSILVAENGRQALSATTVSTNTVTYTATFPAGTGTSTSPGIQEAGIFNASGSGAGTMLCRTVFPSVAKASGDSIAITWVVTVS